MALENVSRFLIVFCHFNSLSAEKDFSHGLTCNGKVQKAKNKPLKYNLKSQQKQTIIIPLKTIKLIGFILFNVEIVKFVIFYLK